MAHAYGVVHAFMTCYGHLAYVWSCSGLCRHRNAAKAVGCTDVGAANLIEPCCTGAKFCSWVLTGMDYVLVCSSDSSPLLPVSCLESVFDLLEHMPNVWEESCRRLHLLALSFRVLPRRSDQHLVSSLLFFLFL